MFLGIAVVVAGFGTLTWLFYGPWGRPLPPLQNRPTWL